MDPFLDLIRLLRPRATLWGRTDAVGRWGVSFRKRDDLLFCWVEQGECQLLSSQAPPLDLGPNDFVLIRTCTGFTVTSDPSAEPVDSETEAAESVLGQGTQDPVTLRGGRFVFDTANENLLTGMLPSPIHVKAGDTSSQRVRSLLKINEEECSRTGPGSDFIIARLMELILVEILRSEPFRAGSTQTGLLAGLADPVTSRALSMMHKDIAHDWAVSELAQYCSVSRSTFAERFRRIVGVSPIDYLLGWRMAVARDELRQGTHSIGEIASQVGFRSPSAFSKAFTRTTGQSPKAFATGRQVSQPTASDQVRQL
jgi:AraC-like DNA-binding protein